MPQVKDIYAIYEEILSGELKQFPQSTWSLPEEAKSTLLKLVRYLVHERFQWDRQDFCNDFCLRTIISYRLNTGFLKVYKRNIFPLVTDAFPDWKINAWEMRKSRVPARFWTEKTTIEATRWLIENRLVWSLSKVQTNISNSHFLNNNLGGMLRTMKVGAVDSIVLSYPGHDWMYLIERAGYKLTGEDKRAIENLLKENQFNQRQIANAFEISPATVNLIQKEMYEGD